jgi:hypothetical protein
MTTIPYKNIHKLVIIELKAYSKGDELKFRDMQKETKKERQKDRHLMQDERERDAGWQAYRQTYTANCSTRKFK